jgi:1,4-alpha-glucan branching enzyme
MEAIGAFTFVLHSHLPYCRMAGRWPHGEEWLHEAAAETYIPLLSALTDLHEEGLPIHLTLGLTPVLCEQLADPLVQGNFQTYLEEKIAAAEQDIPRFQGESNPHAAYLAGFYRDWYAGTLQAFRERFGGDILGGFRRLQEGGAIEIITCGATHGYLPLLGNDAAIRGQLRAAKSSYRRHFGIEPRAIWLPECAYRPAYVDQDGQLRPGIEAFLAQEGLGCFFVETHAIQGGRPVGKAAGDAIGPYGAIKRNYVVPLEQFEAPVEPLTTDRPYYVIDSTSETGSSHSGVAAIGRNNSTGMQVWSAEWGYPGEYDYREFHKKDHVSGLQYWRVSGSQVDLGHKDWYHPDWAQGKVGEHARHFAWLVTDTLERSHAATSRFNLVASNYDTELFGHWWFEGIDWIQQVLRALAGEERVELVTASTYLETHPPDDVIALPESSWGMGGGHWTWDNPETKWMWEPIHLAEKGMAEVARAKSSQASRDEEVVLNQAARELLLLESSDWPFLVTTGQAREYAVQRFTTHVERFERLVSSIAENQPDTALAEELWELDKVFPEVDFRWWA